MEINYKELFCDENEKPLDRLLPGGGFATIFRTVGCVGDSLSSGEFESGNPDGSSGYHDMYEHSWGQYLARMNGCKVYNFSRGGMSAKWYCDTFADENDYWNPEYACTAYIIALGVNDLIGNKEAEIGSVADVDFDDWHNNKQNYAGYYATIIQRLKEIQPRAKFFLMTMPDSDSDESRPRKEGQAKLMYDFAERFENTYVLDFFKYAPRYDAAFREKFYLRGHLNPMGYVLTAQMVNSYLDYIIRHNMDDFREVGFIGTDLHG